MSTTDGTRGPDRDDQPDTASTAPAATAPGIPTAPVAPAPAKSTRRRTGLVIASVATVVALGVGGQAVASVAYVGALASRLMPDSSSNDTSSPYFGGRDPRFGGLDGGDQNSGGTGGYRFPGGNGSTETQSSTTDATASTADQQVGVVTILTTIGYSDSAQAAGTGMIMTAGGLILTNNHVIDGSTSIEVTVESTGKTYDAELVGTDSTADVAVLRIDGVSGLDTVQFDDGDVTVSDEVYSVGNAAGTGELVTAAGSVTGLEESIQVQNESTGVPENLTGLIEVDSDVVSGDSGGPLFNADGDVVGIITAASSGSSTITGYAIPVADAMTVVKQIESGAETSSVQIGYPAFLGIELARVGVASPGVAIAGVTVGGVIDGMPAAAAGLVAGDVVTAVDGTAVADSDALSTLIASHEPGDSVAVAWTTATGAAQTAQVTLVEGPA